MRKSLLALALPVILLGCPQKDTASVDDAAIDAAPAAALAAGPEATNDSAITRYPDERAIEHEAATIKAAKATETMTV